MIDVQQDSLDDIAECFDTARESLEHIGVPAGIGHGTGRGIILQHLGGWLFMHTTAIILPSWESRDLAGDLRPDVVCLQVNYGVLSIFAARHIPICAGIDGPVPPVEQIAEAVRSPRMQHQRELKITTRDRLHIMTARVTIIEISTQGHNPSACLSGELECDAADSPRPAIGLGQHRDPPGMVLRLSYSRVQMRQSCLPASSLVSWD